ncbi:hypothetical protein SAMN04487829_0509 [Pseudobutyrivibrio sp. NOR37]|uniref:Uncharacterized protein n=1 Tax=Pseudobutyrivibrio xylanivorans TaxID=185007 RepID=A0A6M0LG71_PSEXY|nr:MULTISPECIES: hypothetical protein [Pseudobutyrivibrio]NEX00927.1 hypothetical protein [Pseudobutyrivibrio xylanivorans]SFR63751.1 hypothetical protein SAMN04487829_0509 [Pseudobutyrivibrio sp. NOR37]
MEILKRVSRFLDKIVFFFTTLAIAGVFYEGMTLKWYEVVGILVICMEYSFLPATIIHLIVDKKDEIYMLHVMSMLLIIFAFAIKFLIGSFPALGLLLWYFYIWFLYGGILVGRYVEKVKNNCMQEK